MVLMTFPANALSGEVIVSRRLSDNLPSGGRIRKLFFKLPHTIEIRPNLLLVMIYYLTLAVIFSKFFLRFCERLQYMTTIIEITERIQLLTGKTETMIPLNM